MTYLELCQELVRELGIGGATGPTAVTGQQGELLNVTRWIRDSALWIDNLWIDWKYLWVEYVNVITTAGGRVPPAPTTPVGVLVRKWDRTSFFLNKSIGDWSRLKYCDYYNEYRGVYDVGEGTQQNARPSRITILPNNTLRLDQTTEVTRELRGEFWRRPVALAANNDVPLMPAEFHRIIMARAAIMYGNREDAPEIISGMEAEYIDLLDKLQSDQAPSFAQDRSSAQDAQTMGAIPGRE